MDTKEFIASLVGSLAWPVSAAVVAFMFRSELKALMKRPMSRLAVGPVEAEWHPTAEQTREALDDMAQEDLSLQEAIVDREGVPKVPDAGYTAHLRPVAEVDPSAAVLAAYALVGNELLRRLRDAGQPDLPTARFSVRHLAVVARNLRLISPAALAAIQGLDSLRNIAAHDYERRVTEAEANEFLELVDTALFTLAVQNPDLS